MKDIKQQGQWVKKEENEKNSLFFSTWDAFGGRNTYLKQLESLLLKIDIYFFKWKISSFFSFILELNS